MNDDDAFQRGLALYADGKPFEAHEEWEHCWRAAKARNDTRDERFLRGLIHLCAARVKVRQHNDVGLRSHLESAVTLLGEVDVAMQRGIDVGALHARVKAIFEASRPAAAVEDLELS